MSDDFSDSIVVTGCDENHFELAQDFIQSVHDHKTLNYASGFINMSSTGAEFPDIERWFDKWAASPGAVGTDFSEIKGFKCGYLNTKALMPQLFPGFRRYLWIDADCWVQNEAGIIECLNACERHDFAVHPESDVHYSQSYTRDYRHEMVYRQIFPKAEERHKVELIRRPMINAGVLSARADSPLWRVWTDMMDEIRNRPDPNREMFYCDQVPLHYLMYSNQLSYYPLRSTNNWQTYAAVPTINSKTGKLCLPTSPHEEINIIHLAAKSKSTVFNFGPLGQTPLRYRHFKKFVNEMSGSTLEKAGT